MGIDFKNFREKMEAAGETGVSKFKMRSEALQEKQKSARFSMLKKEKKKKSKILIVRELAVPFDPATGEETDKFNPLCKWRPPYSATSMMLFVKHLANENENAKKTFMERAGVENWDTSDLENLTETDDLVLGKYLVPRIFTIPTVNVKIPSIAGNNYGKNYTLSVETDPISGEYVGDVPIILQAHKFFIEKAYEELTQYNDAISSGKIKHDESKQKEHKSEIFSKVVVSDLNPDNFLQIIEVPLNNQYDLADLDEFKNITEEKVAGRVCIARMNVALKDAINKFKNNELIKFDKYRDYYVFDMSCPSDSDDPAEIGRRTSYEKETEKLFDMDDFNNFNNAVIAYLDHENNLEEKVYRSSYTSKYDEAAENRLIVALKDVVDIDDKYVTQKLLKANKDFINCICGDAGTKALLDTEIGISDKDEGNLDSKAAKEVSKEFSGGDDISIDEIDIDAMLK